MLNSKKDQANQYLDADILQRLAEMLSRTLKNHMLEAETKKLTALTNEMEEIRLRGSAAAVVRVPNPNFKPTEFDLNNYTNSSEAKRNGIEENMPSSTQKGNLSKVHECIDTLTVFLGYRPNINSGFRNSEVNSIVGGEAGSLHLEGQAADLGIPKNDYDKVMQWLKNTNNIPEITTAIVYPNAKIGYIHISVADSSTTNGGKKRSLLKKYKGDPKYYQYF